MSANLQHGSSSSDLTMAVLGCGTMGIAILNGILTSHSVIQVPQPLNTPSSSGISTPAEGPTPQALPRRFIACVRSVESAQRIKTTLRDHAATVKVVRNENVVAARNADVILLACKPYMISDVLGEQGMSAALQGKLLISICAGVTVDHIDTALSHNTDSNLKVDSPQRCTIVRAMCNTAALIRESMTVVSITNPPLPASTKALVTWIFKRVGDVIYLPEHNMDVSTALVGSAPAMFSLMLEAAIDGAVAMGLSRAEAQQMATQAMRGTTGLVRSGEHPAILREKVSTPGGCTIGGLLVLEEGRVRGSISRAIRETTCVASQLGRGIQEVKGTRFNRSS